MAALSGGGRRGRSERRSPILLAFRRFAVATLLALAAQPSIAAESARELADRVLAAYGGRDKLAAVQRLHAVGTTSSLRTGTRGPSERWFAPPDRLRIDISYTPQYSESRILAGTQSWKDGAPSNEPFRQAMVLQAARFRLPLILVERPLRDAGETVVDGRTLRTLSVDLGGGMNLDVSVEPGTARIAQSRGTVVYGGQSMEFATRYDDYRAVGGVLFAHREQHFAMGMNTGETVLTRIEINPTLPDGIFRP